MQAFRGQPVDDPAQSIAAVLFETTVQAWRVEHMKKKGDGKSKFSTELNPYNQLLSGLQKK